MPVGYDNLVEVLPPRFWDYVDRTDACWVWLGSLANDGYGRFRFEGKQWYAHRLAYELWFGLVADGFELDHLCRNRACVLPTHLEPVTRRTNILRGEGAPAQNARRESCINGHLLDGDNLQIRGGRRQCRACHRQRQREYKRRLRERRKGGAEALSTLTAT